MISNLSTNAKDKKPFKGKGARDWHASSLRQYEKILKEMRQVSENSKFSGGRNYYAMLHHRPDTGQYFLRWRSFGEKHIHLSWEQIKPAVDSMSNYLQDYYCDLNDYMELLNAQERAARSAINMASKLCEGV